jgi:hypothetical protein
MAKRPGLAITVLALSSCVPAAFGQAADSPSNHPVDQQTLNRLLDRLAADEQKIQELERRLQSGAAAAPANASSSAVTTVPPATVVAAAAAQTSTAAPAPGPVAAPADDLGNGLAADNSSHDHMGLSVGQLLHINGYFDFNFGLGQNSNPLIFPLGADPHTTFQAGELALMTHSQLSDKLSFMSEIVIGSDPTNEFGVDIERYLLSYHQSKYFEISGGRFHTSIGYYNTAYHHGTWFQTATGRPFMYFFEDSGGLLPVHTVGVTTTGLVPGTEKIGLHCVAEVGNGRPSNADAPGAVQNFYSDRNHKAFNVAAYINPEWMPTLQIGGSLYKDRLYPTGLPAADQTISSFYVTYINPTWEILNEGVLLTNRMQQGRTFNTPMAYTQVSRKFGIMRPFVRYQYLNSPSGDPVNVYHGLYTGPSVGVRWDAAEFLAFKLQGNLLQQSNNTFTTGVNAQVALTF